MTVATAGGPRGAAVPVACACPTGVWCLREARNQMICLSILQARDDCQDRAGRGMSVAARLILLV